MRTRQDKNTMGHLRVESKTLSVKNLAQIYHAPHQYLLPPLV